MLMKSEKLNQTGSTLLPLSTSSLMEVVLHRIYVIKHSLKGTRNALPYHHWSVYSIISSVFGVIWVWMISDERFVRWQGCWRNGSWNAPLIWKIRNSLDHRPQTVLWQRSTLSIQDFSRKNEWFSVHYSPIKPTRCDQSHNGLSVTTEACMHGSTGDLQEPMWRLVLHNNNCKSHQIHSGGLCTVYLDYSVGTSELT